MSTVYAIISGKGGVGKTSSAVNLGAALNKFKEDVVIVDANLTTPNLGLYFGAPIVPVNLNHVLQNKAEIGEAIYEHESGTKIIPSSLSLKDVKKIDSKKMEEITKDLKKISNYIILDSAAGLGEEAKFAINSADEIIVVANPNILSVTDALKTITLAKELNKQVKGVIVTRVSGDRNEMPLQSIKEMLEVPILGIIPEDKAIGESLAKKNAVVHTRPGSKSAQAYLDLAAKILGKTRKPDTFSVRFLKAVGLR
ncbi:MAG: cell division ATPase MinD [Candidatus Pacearchaeota archaeon]|nr:cell division ATPase MinD [Candidatus Pacearchaeota archaeon]